MQVRATQKLWHRTVQCCTTVTALHYLLASEFLALRTNFTYLTNLRELPSRINIINLHNKINSTRNKSSVGDTNMEAAFAKLEWHIQILREHTNIAPLVGGHEDSQKSHCYFPYASQVTKLKTHVTNWILQKNSGRQSSLYSHLKDVTAYFNAGLFYGLLSRELFISANHYWTWLANPESQFKLYGELISNQISQYC